MSTKKTVDSDKDFKEFLEASAKCKLDSFFLHQCVVRSFSQLRPELFDRLVAIRKKLELIISKNTHCPYVENTYIVFHVMNAFKLKKVVSLLISEELDKCKSYIFSDEYPFGSLLPVLLLEEVVSDEIMDEVILFMKDSFKSILDILQATDVFSYYDIYSLTVIIDMASLFKLQNLTASNKLKIQNPFCHFPDYAKWTKVKFNTPINSIKEKLIFEEYGLEQIYQDLFVLLECGGVIRKFNQENIKIIQDDSCDIVIDGESSRGRIYLSVPYNQVPVDIDSAIGFFKECLIGLIKDKFPRYRFGNEDFWNSDFVGLSKPIKAITADSRKSTIMLVQHNSYLRYQYGLFVWDQVKIHAKTIDEALEFVKSYCSKIEFKLDIYDRAEDTIKNDYDFVASSINSRCKSKHFSQKLSRMKKVII